jgi:hypothetical protein
VGKASTTALASMLTGCVAGASSHLSSTTATQAFAAALSRLPTGALDWPGFPILAPRRRVSMRSAVR